MSTALEAALSAIAEFPTPDDESKIIAAKARGLVIGYDARWKDSEWECLAVEEVFHLPLINPETGAKSRTFTHAGKKDVIAVHADRKYIVDHKTTSDSIEDPGGSFWDQLAVESQATGYLLAEWQEGRKMDGALWDVIKKPGIRPKEIPKADLSYLLQSRTYCGYEVPEHIQTRLVGEVKPRECAELYAMRLAAECVENPNKYFQRRIITRLDSDITEFADELWEVGQSIIATRARALEKERGGESAERAHFRNSGSCMQWGSPCTFLKVCSGMDNIDSEKWERTQNPHAELPVFDTPKDGSPGVADPMNILTNSRIKTYQSCKRKHFYKYELGVKRRVEEDRESLIFGTLFHAALEKWWQCFQKGNEHDNASEALAGGDESPTSAAGQKELAF